MVGVNQQEVLRSCQAMSKLQKSSLNFHQGPESTHCDQPKKISRENSISQDLTLTQQTHRDDFGKNTPEY